MMNYDRSMSVDDIQLSVRALNVLQAQNITTIGELIQYTPEQVKAWNWSGAKMVKQIQQALSACGFTLRVVEPPVPTYAELAQLRGVLRARIARDTERLKEVELTIKGIVAVKSRVARSS